MNEQAGIQEIPVGNRLGEHQGQKAAAARQRQAKHDPQQQKIGGQPLGFRQLLKQGNHEVHAGEHGQIPQVVFQQKEGEKGLPGPVLGPLVYAEETGKNAGPQNPGPHQPPGTPQQILGGKGSGQQQSAAEHGKHGDAPAVERHNDALGQPGAGKDLCLSKILIGNVQRDDGQGADHAQQVKIRFSFRLHAESLSVFCLLSFPRRGIMIEAKPQNHSK